MPRSSRNKPLVYRQLGALQLARESALVNGCIVSRGNERIDLTDDNVIAKFVQKFRTAIRVALHGYGVNDVAVFIFRQHQHTLFRDGDNHVVSATPVSSASAIARKDLPRTATSCAYADS